jgi:hypothetical protein
MARVQGKIVKILSDKALIINLGTKDGINVNSTVHVIHTGEEIKDPDNDKSLGNLEYVKAVLRISHAQETISTCVPFSSSQNQDPTSSLYRTVSSDMARVAMDKSPYGEQAEPLNIRSGDIAGMPNIPAIGIGDTVVAV